MSVHSAVPAEVPDTVPSVFAVGSAVAPDGAVIDKGTETNFLRGNEVYLSIDTRGASEPQDIFVSWIDGSGKTLRHDHRRTAPNAGRVVFSSGPTRIWRSGRYSVSVAINDRDVTLKTFDLM